MKTITFFIALFLFSGIVSKSQTYHSDIQVDSKNTFNISRGISRGNITFVIDLVKLKFSIKSSFLTLENRDITHLDSRVMFDENGQRLLRSKYQVTDGFYLYIEEYKTEQSNLLVKFNKVFGLELISDGVTKSFMACYITERQPTIKYDTKIPFANYQQYISNYRIEVDEAEKVEYKRTDVLIEIDTVSQFVSFNNQARRKLTFIKRGETEYLGGLWKFTKNQIEESEVEFLNIFKTEIPVKIGNLYYDKIYTIETIDLISSKTTSSLSLFVSTSAAQKEGQQYFEEPDGGN
jgi:D-Tyr-tRNAtyr deacylase